MDWGWNMLGHVSASAEARLILLEWLEYRLAKLRMPKH